MNIVTVDCGTTNTRVYVVDETGVVVGKGTRPVGVRDTAQTGSKEILSAGIGEALDSALATAGISVDRVSFAISSGMITSEIGLKELPHLEAPVGIDAMAAGIERVDPIAPFPQKLPVYFIRGVKNRANWERIPRSDVGYLDFMRGEEAQTMGVLALNRLDPPFTIVILSSHTKFVSVDAKGRIAGSLTTLSGQVYASIMAESFIAKSIETPQGMEIPPIDPAVIDEAYRWTTSAGLLRSLLMTRFMDVLLSTEWHERRLFVEASLASADLQAMSQFDRMGFDKNTPFLLIGKARRCEIYRRLITKNLRIQQPVTTMCEAADIDLLSIHGALTLARRLGLDSRHVN